MSTQTIISMVPSWTETLVSCGVPIVGRTNYCIHPENQVDDIPIVGGTKNIDWDKVFELHATTLLLDKEENPIEFSEGSPIPVFATHVTSLLDVAKECDRMADEFQNKKLKDLARRWFKIHEKPNFKMDHFEKFPVIEWLKKPKYDGDIKWIYYLIWKDPWMCVSKETFIASVISKLGLGFMIKESDMRYPTIELNKLNPRETLLLFSSEPYPFQKKIDEIKKIGFPSALVNGELFGWFGIRSLEFIENFFNEHS